LLLFYTLVRKKIWLLGFGLYWDRLHV
jgi:hypothetical protein